MTNTQLISKFIDVDVGNKIGYCKMCGCKTEHGFVSKDYIKDTRFTNFDELKRIESDIICEHCAACMKETKLRRSGYIADQEQLIFLKKMISRIMCLILKISSREILCSASQRVLKSIRLSKLL